MKCLLSLGQFCIILRFSYGSLRGFGMLQFS